MTIERDYGGTKFMKRSFLSRVQMVLIAFALGGCSTVSPIVSEWRNPSYSSASFKRIMIGGLGGETSIRRNFEDEFMHQLRAAGVDALPSYRYISENEKSDERSEEHTSELQSPTNIV